MSFFPSRLERSVIAFRAALIRRDAAAQQQIVRALTLAEANLQPLVDALLAEIAAQEDDVSPTTLRELATYRALLEQIAIEMNSFGKTTATLLSAQVPQAARDGAQAARDAVQSVGVEARWTPLQAPALREIVGSISGGPLGDLLETFGTASRDAAERILLDGITRGKNARTVGDALQAAVGVTRNRAQVIARTEILRAGKQANLASYAANPVAVSGWTWHANKGPRTCSACLIMDGRQFPLEVTFFPGHPQCRCVARPVLRGFPETGQETGREWLAKQTEATQRSILGNKAYEAWKNGDVELDDLVTVRRSEQWGDSYAPASLKTATSNATRRRLGTETRPERITPTPRPGSGDLEISGKLAKDLQTPTRQRLPNSISPHMFINDDGTFRFAPVRQEAHDQIVREALANVPTSENPTVYMLGGGPAAGKSTMLASGAIEFPAEADAVQSNPDLFKEQLPEYKSMVEDGDPTAADYQHEESSYVSKRVNKAAIESGRDLVIDGVGKNFADIAALTRPNGYRLVGHYAFVDPELAVKRATDRAAKTGRVVPIDYIRAAHKSVSQVWLDAVKTFDEITLYDTTEGARPVARAVNGRLVIEDPERYAYFLSIGQ